MYNLDVLGNDNFFVGEKSWLVHNSNSNSLVTFYTVQTEADAMRLRSGGSPWPTGMSRANMGSGLYAWGTPQEAAQYAARLQAKGVSVETIRLQMTTKAFGKLNGVDLTRMSDAQVNAWMQKYGCVALISVG